MKPFALVTMAMLALPAAVQAQSVDDLIRALRPHGGGPTRGIRVMGPVAPELAAPELAAPELAVPDTPIAAPIAAHPDLPPIASTQAGTMRAGDLAAISLQVQFEHGSDRLTPAARQTLDTLGRALANAQLSAYRFRIEGHTDAVGSRGMNQALSERRAAAVVAYIAGHYGVERSRLTMLGLGQSRLLVPTADGVAEPRNRRVQIVNVGS